MLVLSALACGPDPRTVALEREVTALRSTVSELQGQLGATDTRVSDLGKDLQARVADLDARVSEGDRRTARGKALGALVGRWNVHAEPLANHGCDAPPYPSDYTWDVAGEGPQLRITVGGATSFPEIAATVNEGVLSGTSVREDGSVATVVAERQGDTLAGYRVFAPRGADDRCAMTWRLTATRAGAP